MENFKIQKNLNIKIYENFSFVSVLREIIYYFE